MEKDEARLSLKSLIEEEMPDIADVDFDKDIIQEYGINSVSIIKIIVAAERKFGIVFTDYELSLDEYGTFGDLAAVIKEKVDNKED
ncbi:MAG: acyl carrier protein [Eubacterium sp.]|nr:acyl carrier protein [Eubacterium sp.]